MRSSIAKSAGLKRGRQNADKATIAPAFHDATDNLMARQIGGAIPVFWRLPGPGLTRISGIFLLFSGFCAGTCVAGPPPLTFPRQVRAVGLRHAGATLPTAMRGDELSVACVIPVPSKQSREPKIFLLRLRSPSDVSVTRAASWWNLAHAEDALVVTILSAFVLLIGIAFMRRIIERQVAVIRESELQFRLLVSQVKDYAILHLDPRGYITSWNDGAARIKGYRAEEIIGQRFTCFYPTEDVTRGKPDLELKVAADKGVYEEEGWRVRKDGSRFWAHVSITALRDDDGQLRGFGKVTRDVTEPKRAEDEIRRLNAELESRVTVRTAELTAANKELEAFTYTAAHDLRAPLRHMHGFVGALREDCYDQLDGDGRRYLDKIATSSRDMGLLLDDLLNFSRLGRVELRHERVDLNRTVLHIRQELAPECEGRMLAWQVAELPVVQGDPTLLHQLLFNLISNAVKYTRRCDNARIEIGVARVVGEEAIFVRDNGAGFEMEYVEKLFHVFQRLHRPDEFEGTGIGLAIVRRIAERHGARAWAEGAPGRGATFYVSLPLEATEWKGIEDGEARVHSAGG